jgi:membrane-associated protease RseP (regulator of RpoE activity)
MRPALAPPDVDKEKSMKKVFVIGSLLVVLTLSLGGSVASKGTDNSPTYEQLRLFTEVLSIVQNQYVDEVPPKDLIYGAIKGTLRGLDPHSSFLDPDSLKEMQVETSGSFGGLGIEITLRDDILTVVSPIEGTPAFRAGLQPGDRIIKIDGLTTKDMQLSDAVKRMRGKPGTKVTISVVREGWTESKDVDIQREVIHVQSVRTHDLGEGVGATVDLLGVGPGLSGVSLTLNQAIFHGGNTLTLAATTYAGTTPRAVDAYIAAQLPDGTLLFLQTDGSLTLEIRPIVSNWPVAPFSGEIFRYTFGGHEPSGSYRWLAAFAEPGTANVIGLAAQASFTFSP